MVLNKRFTIGKKIKATPDRHRKVAHKKFMQCHYMTFERKNQYNDFEKQPQVDIISNTQMPKQVIRIELNPDGSVRKISKNKK